MRWLLLMIFFIGCLHTTYGQTPTSKSILFSPMWGEEVLKPDTNYQINGGGITFEVLRFYISSLELLMDDKIIFKEKKSVHLIDMSIPSSLSINLDMQDDLTYNKIKFNLGIDSLTNVSGALGGDLDPVKGMYWTWQSGYINLKMEGVSDLCKTRKNKFVFHLGGYKKPFYGMQPIELLIDTKSTNILFDVKRIIEKADISTHNHIMSPNLEAVKMAELIASNFYIGLNK